MDKDVLLKKITEMKQSAFGVTAIKIELEADFNRPDGDDCSNCNAEGTVDCDLCYAEGDIANPEWRTGDDQDDRRITCPNCDGTGNATCDDCDGQGANNDDLASEQSCYEYIMQKLEEHGLAEKRETTRSVYFKHYGNTCEYDTYWHPAGALAYAAFYSDGSVDSEFTFTLKLDNPEDALLIPKIVDAFTSIKDETDYMNLDRAGMHMALLNSSDARYPSTPTEADERRFNNFRRSMSLFMPALYFLGSHDSKSRDLGFRQPRAADAKTEVTDNNRNFDNNAKYSAIYFGNGALEYRLFETSYGKPERIFDNMVVIANTLKYWSDEYRPSGLSRITKEVKFGNDKDRTIKRFYQTTQHIDLLNEGLKKLKPSYYTITEMKKQRGFDVTKRALGNELEEARQKAIKRYANHVKNTKWKERIVRTRAEAAIMERYIDDIRDISEQSEEEMLTEIRNRVNTYVSENFNFEVENMDTFVEKAVQSVVNDLGRFTLKEEETPDNPASTNLTHTLWGSRAYTIRMFS